MNTNRKHARNRPATNNVRRTGLRHHETTPHGGKFVVNWTFYGSSFVHAKTCETMDEAAAFTLKLIADNRH